MADDPHEYSHHTGAAAAYLYWWPNELPVAYHAARRSAVTTLLDDAVQLFRAHGREAEYTHDGPWSGGTWQFHTLPDTWVDVGVTPEGVVRAQSRRGTYGRDLDRFGYQPRFDVAAGKLVGGAIKTGSGAVLRDLRAPGSPFLFASPLEDLVEAIMSA